MIKIYQIILNIFLFFVFIVSFWNYWFALESNDKNMSIKELKEDIEVLKSKKVINKSIFEKFKQSNWELSNYFDKNLSEKDLKDIGEIIKKYHLDKKNIKNSNKLLELKINLYKSFLPFISKNKISLFNKFIEKNISTIKKTEEIKNDIKNKEKIIKEKVLVIKDKIEKNHKREEERLKLIFRKKISEKIYAFKNSKKINNLSLEKKKNLFSVVLKRIQSIKKSKNKNFTEKQKYIISIIEETLIEIINKLK